jgi:hypothetical protein
MRLGAMGARGGFGSAGVLGSASRPPGLPIQPNGQPFLIFADLNNGYYWFNGRRYADQATWLTAMGATAQADPPFLIPWTYGNVLTAIFEGVTQVNNAAEGELYQWDSGVDTNYIGARRQTTQVTRHQIVNATTTRIDQSLSAIGTSTAFRNCFTCGGDSGIFGFSNNGDVVTPSPAALSGTAPAGITTMRVGDRVALDRLWTNNEGQIWRFAATNVACTQAQVQAYATPSYIAWGDGDSWMVGAAGIGIGPSLAKTNKKFCKITAVGGDTLVNEVSRVQSSTSLQSLPLFFCDGDNNGYDATVANDVVRYQSASTAVGGRIVIFGPSVRANQIADQNQHSKDLNTALLAAFPNNFIDPRDVAVTLAPLSSGNIDTSLLQADGIHPTRAFADALAAAGLAKARTLGYPV